MSKCQSSPDFSEGVPLDIFFPFVHSMLLPLGNANNTRKVSPFLLKCNGALMFIVTLSCPFLIHISCSPKLPVSIKPFKICECERFTQHVKKITTQITL